MRVSPFFSAAITDLTLRFRKNVGFSHRSFPYERRSPALALHDEIFLIG